MYKVFLSLGSNLGDRENNLMEAIKKIKDMDEIKLTKVSNIYETEPVGYLEQGRFLNMAIKLLTKLAPLELLNKLQAVENLLMRTREIHWGPRTIDIDILMIDNLKMDTKELTVPHPRMLERAFVLVPLMELTEEGDFEGDISEYIDNCKDKNGVVLYKKFEDVVQD
ncbi:MAG: 2-amino-4-hydroxy-6-hydroxymethyldihydropteridine diphosphokinase [Clostridiaceae bacterium]|jgi:2-amino-4-hydroxy-6-hydroxymethyldihydropteridine diphosphokinase|nr:2-amino-4-hydroxy-6-hydroxymethyldihydropteridine diphosphokinase [Clostridiaceae bacterium]